MLSKIHEIKKEIKLDWKSEFGINSVHFMSQALHWSLVHIKYKRHPIQKCYHSFNVN